MLYAVENGWETFGSSDKARSVCRLHNIITPTPNRNKLTSWTRQQRYCRMAVKGRKAEILVQRRVIPVFCTAQKVPVEAAIWKLFQLLLRPEDRLHTPAAYHHFSTSLPLPFFPPSRGSCPLCSAFSTALCSVRSCKWASQEKIKTNPTINKAEHFSKEERMKNRWFSST